MARLGVFPRPGPPGEGFMLDVKSNLLSHLKTRAVVLLLPEGRYAAVWARSMPSTT